MPYISPTTNPAEALNGLGATLFPDPSRIAQAQYAGAHTRNMDAQTQELQRQGIAKNALSQTLSAAVANPNQQTIGDAVSTALAAGYKPEDVVRGALAAHQAAGAPGGPQMAQSLADTITSMVGGTPFANTQTGQGRELQNRRDVANIGIQPGMAQVGLNRDIANNNRVFVDQSGNRVVVPMGQPIAAGLMPEDTSRAFGTANIGIQPAMEQQRRETNTPQAFIDPETGKTNYRLPVPGAPMPPPNSMPAQQGAGVLSSTISAQPALAGQVRETAQWQDKPQPYMRTSDGAMVYRRPGDPLPPSDFLPVEQAGPIAQTQISTAPGMLTANAPKPYVEPGNGPTGVTTNYYRASDTPPRGAVPLDAANPVQTGVGVGMFGAPQADPNALPTAPAPATSGMAVRTGLGGLISGSGGTGPTAAAPAPAPGLPETGTQAPTAPAERTDMFGTLARSAATSAMGAPGAEKPAEDATWAKAIKGLMTEYQAQHETGIGARFRGSFDLEDRAKQRLVARTGELMRTRGPTFSAFTPALQKAWSELAPTLQRDRPSFWSTDNAPSLLRLPDAPQQGGGTGAVPAAGTPTRGPAGTTPTRTEPVPAPGNLPKEGPSAPAPASAALSSIIAPDGTQAAPAPVQAAPQLAQAAPEPAQAAPPVPLNPAERQPGQVYTSRVNGRRALWTGQAFVPAP